MMILPFNTLEVPLCNSSINQRATWNHLTTLDSILGRVINSNLDLEEVCLLTMGKGATDEQ
jgi:hypothetical protein